jgi:hypothetical protein
MYICRRCAGLYETRDAANVVDRGRIVRRQVCECLCHKQQKWPGLDFNEHTCLCYCCMREKLRSGSRWSVWFCQECRDCVLTLNRRIGIALIPIGRHSLMNAVGLRGEDAGDPAEVKAFVVRLDDFFGRVNDLHEWRRVKLRTNLMRLGLLSTEDVSFDEYLPALKRRQDHDLSKRRSFIDLCRFFEVPKVLIDS